MIKIPRGNTLDLAIKITDASGNPYVLQENDTAIFTVKTNDCAFEKPIIQKFLTADNYNDTGELVIKITPEDTIDKTKGDYKYDFAVCVNGCDFYTTILADVFRILPALSCKGDLTNA